MRPSRMKNTDALLQRQNIAQRAVALNRINTQVQKMIECQDQCRVANYRQGILILELSSSHWTWRLNYQKSHLMEHLKTNGLPNLKNIEFVINPALMTAILEPEAIFHRKPISEETADKLNDIKKYASNKLQDRLNNLAKLAKKKR
jgi:hypothetical protein